MYEDIGRVSGSMMKLTVITQTLPLHFAIESFQERGKIEMSCLGDSEKDVQLIND